MGYRGYIAELPIAYDGLTGSKNMSQVGIAEVIRANNVTFESGTLQKEGGASKYNSSALSGTPTILGGHDWHPTVGTQRMIVFTDVGSILKDSGDGTFPTTLVTGLSSPTCVPLFIAGGSETVGADRKLFVFTGNNVVKVLAADGSSMTTIATPPADWGTKQPRSGVIHEGRLWGLAGHRAYYSMTSNHENFSGAGAGSIIVHPGEGEELIAGVSFKGLLILFKYPYGVYAIDTSDPDTANWRVIIISHTVGLRSANALTQVDDDVMFMDTQAAVHVLSAVQEFGSVKASSITEVANLEPFLRDNVNLGSLDKTQTVFYEAKREVHFAIPGKGSSIANRRLIIDFNRANRPRFRFSERDTCPALWLRFDSDGVARPMMGDDAGFVWYLDQENRNKDGSGYEGAVSTGYYDLSHLDPKLASKRKIAQFLELLVEPIGDWNLTVELNWDDLFRETVQFNMGSAGATLGSFILGTDKLAATSVRGVKKRLRGGGKRLQLIFRNSGANENFSLARAFLYFKVGDEDEARSN